MKKNAEKKLSEIISEFIKYQQQVVADYKYSYDSVNQSDRAIQDYLHKIENCSARERPRVATELANSRKERRKNRVVTYVSEAFVDWAERNQSVIKELERVLGEVRRREQNGAVYYPRVLEEPPTQINNSPQYLVRK